MSNGPSIIQDILNAANNISRTPVAEENSISNLLQSTRSLFRRSDSRSIRSRNEIPNRVRGRRSNATFKRKVFLLKLSHADFFPGTAEQAFLRRRSLGLAVEQAEIGRSWGIDTIKHYIASLYPTNIVDLLNMSDFDLAKCERSKKLLLLQNINTGAELEEAVGNGIIIIRPMRDFPSDLPLAIIDVERQQPNVRSELDATLRPSSRSRNSTNLDRESRNTTRVLQQGPLALHLQPEFYEEISLSRNNSRNNINLETETANSILMLDNVDQHEPPVCHLQFEFPEEENNLIVTSVLDYPTIGNDDKPREMLEVSRVDIVEALFKIYKDESLMTKSIFVRFIGEIGIDDGGLSRELFSIFWRNIFSSVNYFKGHDIVVPYIPLHMIRKKIADYTILGRILSHTLLLTHSFPNKLARIIYVMLGNEDFEGYKKNLLLDEYLLFLTVPERRLVQKALRQFDNLTGREKDRLNALFNCNQFYEIPKKDEIIDQIKAIAEKILIKDSADFINEMKKGLSDNIKAFLRSLSLNDISNEWIKNKPSPEKVMNCLVLSDINLYTTNDEERTYFFLQNYVGSLSQGKLENFLLFVTGGVNMPERITVTFHKQIGIGRRPIAHTCSSLLELATNYDSQQEFNFEFDGFLNLDSSYEYSLL